jgi:glycolate oxidase FAD binding subunit
MAKALNSPHDVSGAAYLPQDVAARSAVEYVRGRGASVAAVRLEGTATSLGVRTNALRALFATLGAIEELHTMNSGKFWREVRDVAPLLRNREAAIWRISVPPSEGPRIAGALGAVDHFFDWGGGLIWAAVPAAGDAAAAAIRATIGASGGHASLMRAPEPLRAAVEVFEPRPAALALLTNRVKDAFDPRRILNPGRMYAGL